LTATWTWTGTSHVDDVSDQRAIKFLALVYDLVDRLADSHGDRTDQLARTADSVVRSIAEGAGRWSEADSSKHDKPA